MNKALKKHLNIAIQKKKENQKLFAGLGKKRNLDALIHGMHDEIFERLDCLTCANCCKTTSPIFRPVDIDRIAKHLRMKAADFTDTYLRVDEDDDFVLQKSPCAFLDEQNYCTIYDVRPLACREYPHTDRKNMHQILDLTYRNTLICPAVAEIAERLKVAANDNSSR
jgi:Fe-S-cluster containining protein